MAERDILERECATFCRYLSGERPSAYVVRQYLAAHAAGVLEPRGGASRFERVTVAIARGSPWLARALDAYSRVFDAGGLLRRKLVVLLAVLEVQASTAEALDAPSGTSKAAMLLGMAALGALFAVTVLVTALVLLPVRAVCALPGGGKG